jgi:hypothetical protein
MRKLAWANIFKAAAAAAAVTALGYGLATLDVLHADSRADAFSANVLQAVSSPFQGVEASRHISVVFLDEAGLDWLETNRGWRRWPPSYANNADMVREVYNAGDQPPRALFLDFQYLKADQDDPGFKAFVGAIGGITHAPKWRDGALNPCPVDSLVKVACIVAAGGTPVIVAGAPDGVDAIRTPGQDTIEDVAVVARVEIRPDAYPMRDTPAALLLAAYCMRDADGDADAGLSACARFKRLRHAAARSLSGDRLAAKRLLTLAAEARADDPEKLRVQWSAMPTAPQNAVNQMVGLPPCRYDVAAEANPVLRLGGKAVAAAQQTLRAASRFSGDPQEGADERPDSLTCPHALSLPYMTVTEGVLPDEVRHQAFDDGLVLVGGYFHTSNDWLATPLHGQVPGVQGHAMALDNLLQATLKGRTRFPSASEPAKDQAEILEAVLLFILVLISGVRRLHLNDVDYRHWLDDQDQARRRLRLWGRYLGLEFGFTVLFVLASFQLFQSLPINWLGVTAAALAWSTLRDRQEIAYDLRLLADRGPWRRPIVWLEIAFRWRSLENRSLWRGPARPPTPAPAPVAEPDTPEPSPAPTPQETSA